jgi:hypothetical protein
VKTRADVSWKHQVGEKVAPLHTEPGYHLEVLADPVSYAEHQHKYLLFRLKDSGSMDVVLDQID